MVIIMLEVVKRYYEKYFKPILSDDKHPHKSTNLFLIDNI